MTVKADYQGILFQPSLHYQTDLPAGDPLASEPSPNDVAQGAWGVFGQELRNTVPAGVVFHEVVAAEEVLKPDIGAAGGYTIGDLPGTLTGSGSGPAALSAVVNLHTELRSRSARGWVKLFSPIATTTYVTGSTWAAAYMTLARAFAAKLDDSFNIGAVIITTVHPVIYSRTRHERGNTPYVFRVTNATVNPQVRWQRSRLSAP